MDSTGCQLRRSSPAGSRNDLPCAAPLHHNPRTSHTSRGRSPPITTLYLRPSTILLPASHLRSKPQPLFAPKTKALLQRPTTSSVFTPPPSAASRPPTGAKPLSDRLIARSSARTLGSLMRMRHYCGEPAEAPTLYLELQPPPLTFSVDCYELPSQQWIHCSLRFALVMSVRSFKGLGWGHVWSSQNPFGVSNMAVASKE